MGLQLMSRDKKYTPAGVSAEQTQARATEERGLLVQDMQRQCV